MKWNKDRKDSRKRTRRTASVLGMWRKNMLKDYPLICEKSIALHNIEKVFIVEDMARKTP